MTLSAKNFTINLDAGVYSTRVVTGGSGGSSGFFFGAAIPTLPTEFTTPTLNTAPTATGKGRYYTPGLIGSPDGALSLQGAIDDAATQTGVNVIVLDVGVDYTAVNEFVLKPHANSWTYIISRHAPELVPFSGAPGAGYATFPGGLPAAGTRINNNANPITSGADDLAHMARLRTSNSSQGGYIFNQETAANVDGRPVAIANHYKFVGIDFSLTEANRPGGIYTLYYVLAFFNSAGVIDGHNNLSWDRCHIAGAPTSGVVHGISANGRNIEITESYLWRTSNLSGGGDANCFFACSGQGPYKFTNNFWENYDGEHIIIGGSNIPNATVNPSDIVIRNNTFKQNPTEVSRLGGGKDFIEFKTGKRVLVDHNFFGYSAFASPQAMIHLMTADQTGGSNPWTEVSDVTIKNNTIFGGIDNSGGLIGVYAAVHDPASPTGFRDAGGGGGAAMPMVRVLIRNNIGFVPTIGSNVLASVISGSPIDCIWDHNTFITPTGPWGASLRFNDDNPNALATRFVYTNNICSPGSNYGFWSSGHATSPLNYGNIIDPHVDNNVWGTPGQPIGGAFTNTYLASTAAFGFVNSAFSDVASCGLALSSLYKGAGKTGLGLAYNVAGTPDGTDIGCDVSLCPTA